MFPTDLKGMEKTIVARQRAAIAAEKNAKRFSGYAKKHKEVLYILRSLTTSWKESDPGKYGDAYFFLESNSRRRVVVREFLAEDEKNSNGFQVVDLSAVLKGKCSKCELPQPVIEHYVQVYDGPDGDEWLKEHLVLCLDCDLMTVIKSETSEDRF